MGSTEWPPCTPSQENKSTQEGQRKVAKYTKQTKPNQTNPDQIPMEVVELISTKERQRSNSNKPGTKAEAELDQTMD